MDISNQKKRLIIIIQVLIGILVAAVVTIVIMRAHSSSPIKPNQCVPSNKKPRLTNINALANIHSHDNKTLVGFSGYLELEDATYLPLDVYNVSLDAVPKGRQELKLMTKCGDLVMQLHVATDQIAEVESIDLSGANGGAEGACKVNKTGIYYGIDQSYVCYAKQELECVRVDDESNPKLQANKVAAIKLVVEALRFEVNGDPKQIAVGKFSKPARFCF